MAKTIEEKARRARAYMPVDCTQALSITVELLRLLSEEIASAPELPEPKRRPWSPGPTAKVFKDKEMCSFLLGLPLEQMTQQDALSRCKKQFGARRAPSRTGLSRHWYRLLDERASRSKEDE
jgi:hypothetical protein